MGKPVILTHDQYKTAIKTKRELFTADDKCNGYSYETAQHTMAYSLSKFKFSSSGSDLACFHSLSTLLYATGLKWH